MMLKYDVRAVRRLGWADAAVFIGFAGILYTMVHLGAGMVSAFSPGDVMEIGLDPMNLPYYAGRSLLRMFLALAASLLFTLIYGYIAAHSRAAGRFMIPLLDILQSVPVLGFLSATVTVLMGLFHGSLLGVELAAVFAIFTGQAWNMTFAFYNSLLTIPKDLQEAAAVLRLSRWQKFVQLEVPFAMIPLIWNAMMSFGGGWFFLAASEAISVLGNDIRLPGIGSYMAVAAADGNLQAIIYAIIAMALLVVAVDFLFWRPLVVWSQRFKLEMTAAAVMPESIVLDILRRSHLLGAVQQAVTCPIRLAIRVLTRTVGVVRPVQPSACWLVDKAVSLFIRIGVLFIVIILLRCAWDAADLLRLFSNQELWEIFLAGLLTFARVTAAVLLGAAWTIPVGVYIGMDQRKAAIVQPIVQVMASFPANLLFPFFTILYLRLQVNFEFGAIPLMMLGTQWYILFNVIAGAMAIPNDLKEAGAVFKLRGWVRWKKFILPAIFPQLVTGAVTASGGAWNASIVSELVTWQGTQLTAKGLGSYISLVTESGYWPGIVAGILMMCLMVAIVNHFVWQRLYGLAERKYHLD